MPGPDRTDAAPRDSCLFVGDGITAQGYRLAGARVRVCGEGDILATVAAAAAEAPVILVGASLVRRLDPGRLRRAAAPALVLPVPDVPGGAVEDLAAATRAQLGGGA